MASMNRTALGYWTIIDSVLRPSKYHEGEYTYITMQNAQGDIVHTNIEDDFKNNNQWAQVLSSLDELNDLVIDNLKYKVVLGKIARDKRTGNSVIDADSLPNIVSETPNAAELAHREQRNSFNNSKLQELIDDGFEQINGKWDISLFVNKTGSRVKELDITRSDDAATMQEKLRIKSMLVHAHMRNQGHQFK